MPNSITHAGSAAFERDPHWANVILAVNFAHMDQDSRDYVDLSPQKHPVTLHTTPNGAADHAESKWGLGSFYQPNTNDSGLGFSVPQDLFNFENRAFTLEAWFRTIATNGVRDIISHHGNPGFNFRVDSGNQLRWYTRTGNRISGASSSVTPGQWYHGCVQSDGTTTEMFLDGVSQGTTTTQPNWNSSHPVHVGARLFSGTYRYSYRGHIDSVRVTRDVARYTPGGFTPPARPFTMR